VQPQRSRAGAAAILTSRLSKDYRTGRGLFDLDLRVEPGEIFGFLGPNGAGKTTTIRLLMGMIHPTRGTAAVYGLDCRREASSVAQLVGYVPGELPQFGGLRGAEVVAYLAAMRGDADRSYVHELAERLDPDLSRRFREYSRGNKQKLALLLAFMWRPQLLILDEPTSGLDPLNQQTFYELARESSGDGATVFLSSHVLSEVEHICTRVGIIRAGRMVDDRRLEDLHGMRFHAVEVTFSGEPPVSAISAASGVSDVSVEGSTVHCNVRGDFGALLSALGWAHVLNLVSSEPNLESLFLTYYEEKTHRDAPAAAAAPHR